MREDSVRHGLFDEDLHISVAGGKRIRIRLADNLKEERSHSFSTSADWYHTFGTVSLNLMAEGFLTVLKDTYALRETGEKADGGKSNIMERYNGSGAKVYGCTLEGRLAVANELSLQAGVTLQRSRYDIAQKWSDDPDVAPDAGIIPLAGLLWLHGGFLQSVQKF